MLARSLFIITKSWRIASRLTSCRRAAPIGMSPADARHVISMQGIYRLSGPFPCYAFSLLNPMVIAPSFSRTAYRTFVTTVQPSRRKASSSSAWVICSRANAAMFTCPFRTRTRVAPSRKRSTRLLFQGHRSGRRRDQCRSRASNR